MGAVSLWVAGEPLRAVGLRGRFPEVGVCRAGSPGGTCPTSGASFLSGTWKVSLASVALLFAFPFEACYLGYLPLS